MTAIRVTTSLLTAIMAVAIVVAMATGDFSAEGSLLLESPWGRMSLIDLYVGVALIFCWVVLIMGMDSKNSIINAPLVSLEVSQSGFGMYVKYLMAGFLGVFGVSMMIQFCAYLLESVADYRGDPGSRLHAHDEELPVH